MAALPIDVSSPLKPTHGIKTPGGDEEFYSPREPVSPPHALPQPRPASPQPKAPGAGADSLSSRFRMGFSGLGAKGGAAPHDDPSPDSSTHPDASGNRAAPSNPTTSFSRIAKGFELFGARANQTMRQAGSTFSSGISTFTQSLAKAVAVRRQTLPAQCKKEAYERPCPRIALICCNALIVGGLDTQGIFIAQPERPELIQSLLQHFEGSQGATLLPEWADSLLIAQTLKAFLQQLPEPILTYRLYRDFISAASQPHTSLDLLSELPLVSLNTFEVLLETCHRLTRHPERNGVSTRRLAEALAPVLLWPPPESYAQPLPQPPGAGFGGPGGSQHHHPNLTRPSQSGSQGGQSVDGELPPTAVAGPEQRTMPEEDQEALTRVMQYLIANFKNPEGYLSN